MSLVISRTFSRAAIAVERYSKGFGTLAYTRPEAPGVTDDGAHAKTCRLDFSDVKSSFKDVKSYELAKYVALLSAIRLGPLAANSGALFELSNKILGKGITNFLISHSLYPHFCGGEDIESLRTTAAVLAERRLGCIVDYAAEASETIEDASWLDANLTRYLDAIDCAASFPKATDSSRSFIAIKYTSFADPNLLERVTTALNFVHFLFVCAMPHGAVPGDQTRHLVYPDNHDILMKLTVPREAFEKVLRTAWPSILEGEVKGMFNECLSLPGRLSSFEVSFFQWNSFFSPLRLAALPKPVNLSSWFNESDIKEWTLTENRMNIVCKHGAERGVYILVDAEQTFFQTAIDWLTTKVMGDINFYGGAFIYTTHQMYLKNSMAKLQYGLEVANQLNFPYAAKLVRGAYMTAESKYAIDKKTDYPIHDLIEQTHHSYDEAIRLMMARLPKIELLCGTHNEESIKKAVDLLQRHDNFSSLPVSFAQLYGMSNYLSVGLAKAGCMAYKYTPYGPLDLVIPYLIRRAEENSSILSGSKRETALINKELRRRIFS